VREIARSYNVSSLAMTSFVLIANIAGREHGREFATLIEARAYGKLLQKQPATISFEIKRAEPSGFIIEEKWKRHGGRMRGMNCLRFESKLREAEFFYSKLLEQEKILDQTPFGFFLSAFLTAATSVRQIFVFEQGQDANNKAVYKNWRDAWDAKLTPEQKSLIDYMEDDRDKEVHTTGSQHNIGREEADKLGVGTHYTPEGVITIFGPPDTFSTCWRPTYKFVMKDGIERKVTDVCGEYLWLRQQMITEFQSNFAQSASHLYQDTLRTVEAAISAKTAGT
jgi:hypothetical protein